MNYISPYFRITGQKRRNKVFLTQEVLHPACHTNCLPGTVNMLEKNIPTIFENECFNYKKVSFRKEVENTEIGHLLEHMILENLKLLAEEKYGKGDFRGETKWNWKKDKKGKFNIVISAKEIEEEMFIRAFDKSVSLLEKIYAY